MLRKLTKLGFRRGVVALCLGAIVVAGSVGFALAQTLSVPVELRVVAQKHPSGAVEVGIEQDGERHLPEFRFISAGAATGRWLRSSPVTLEVDVPGPEPVVRLSVRPSDHPAGLVCLEEANGDGHTWTWTDAEARVTSYTTESGLAMSGIQRGQANVLMAQGRDESLWQEPLFQAAWHAQCASYHGVALRGEGDYATDADDWRSENEPGPVVIEELLEVPLEEPVVRLSVRPSDHPAGLVCLEEANGDGHTWTWTDAEARVTSYTTESGLAMSGIQRGQANVLMAQGRDESLWQEPLFQAAWHAQCASYHGVALRGEGDYATDADDWRSENEPGPVVIEELLEVPLEEPVVRLSVRPSDHPAGLVCLEEANGDGHTWTWTDAEARVTSYTTESGLAMSGIQRGQANVLMAQGRDESLWQEPLFQAAWHAQCASYHGVALRGEGDYATDADDWRSENEPGPVVIEELLEVPLEEPVVRLSVRPSDHPAGLVCLEEANDEGHTWTWNTVEGLTSYTTEFGLFVFGLQRGWAAALQTQEVSQDEWQEQLIQGAWHAQCASYHGVDLRLESEHATDPDDWQGDSSP